MSSRRPQVKRAEREDKVSFSVSLSDAKNPRVVDPRRTWTLSAAPGTGGSLYELSLDLPEEVKVEECKINIGARNIFCVLEKAGKKWWTKLVRGDDNSTHIVKVDSDKWEDDDDVTGGPSDFDLGGVDFSKFGDVGGPGDDATGDECANSDDAGKGEMNRVQFQKNCNHVSHSAVALPCGVTPPLGPKNPYLKDALEFDADPSGNQRSECAGFCHAGLGGNGLSRYRVEFHEIEEIGNGKFNHVFKVLKRLDGCMYAVKHSMKQLHQDTERCKALMEVQALGALRYHKNIVGYYSSWFENELLYIQLELCDHSLSINKLSKSFTEAEALNAIYQIAKALQFIHGRGIAHMDVKPDNICVKDGVYKLGDFGCATLIDKSLPVEEGDVRYMPREILNGNFDNLEKVDIYCLGVSIFELVRGSPLSESGPHYLDLSEEQLPLLPGHFSLEFENLIMAMMNADPVRRPSAKELLQNPIFDCIQRMGKNKQA